MALRDWCLQTLPEACGCIFQRWDSFSQPAILTETSLWCSGLMSGEKPKHQIALHEGLCSTNPHKKTTRISKGCTLFSPPRPDAAANYMKRKIEMKTLLTWDAHDLSESLQDASQSTNLDQHQEQSIKHVKFCPFYSYWLKVCTLISTYKVLWAEKSQLSSMWVYFQLSPICWMLLQ